MESVKVKVGIPDPKHVSCHPGGHDCIQGGGHTKVIGGFSSIVCVGISAGRPPTSFLSTGILPWMLGV